MSLRDNCQAAWMFGTHESTRNHSGLDSVQDFVLPQKIRKLSYLDWSPDYLPAGRDGGRTLSSAHSADEQTEAQTRSELSQGCTVWVQVPGLPLSS